MKLATIDNIKRVLDEVTANFLERGYYFEPEYPDIWGSWKDVRISEQTIQRIMREVAREHGRPFVRIRPIYKWEHVGDGNGTHGWQKAYNVRLDSYHIIIPIRKYLSPLVHPLTLAEAPRVNTTRWGYKLGVEFFNEYIKLFDREEFRAALRLPPKVTPLKEAA